MQGYEVTQNSAAYPLLFLLIQSSDHITGLTGATPTVTISKNGGAFASPAGAVSEIGSGWYKVAGNATDTNTLGPIALHATAASGDPTDMMFPVVAVNPQSATAFVASVATVTTVTNQLTAAQVATGVWQDTTAGDFTTASSIGKSLFTGVAPGAAGGLFIAGTNAATSITTGLTAHIIGTVDTVTTVTNQLTGAAIATAVWTDTTAGDFTTLTSPGKVIFAQLGGAFTTTSSSIFSTASLANAPTGGSAPTAAAIATAVWQDATAGDFTVASSIGKCLYIANVAPGAAGGHFIAGTNAATTVTTSFTTTFTGNLTGSVASVSGAVGSVAGAVGSVAGLTTATIAAAILATPANLLATDASGHVILQPSGLDLVPVEAGLNARQSLSIVAAAVAGVGGTSTNVYAGAGVATQRISFTASAGQRSAVTLSPPA